MKITRTECPGIFENICAFFITDSRKDHRRGSNFYVTSIVEFRTEDAGYYHNVPNYSDFIGTWETNSYIWDDSYGIDGSEITELTKVEKRTKVVETTYWEAV